MNDDLATLYQSLNDLRADADPSDPRIAEMEAEILAQIAMIETQSQSE